MIAKCWFPSIIQGTTRPMIYNLCRSSQVDILVMVTNELSKKQDGCKVLEDGYTSFFFFLCLLLRRGFWASEFELRLLLWSPGWFGTLLFLNDSPLVLLEVLLELDITRLSADLALFGANERGGGIRTRASLWRCKKKGGAVTYKGTQTANLIELRRKLKQPLLKVPGSSHRLTCQMLPYLKHWKLVPCRRLVLVILAHQVKTK
jgi:hypothetical protein